jgi:hypothetical protein
MAVRTPLVDDSSNLREATTAEIDQIKAEMIRQYSLNIPVTLTVVASGGNLGSLTDTRLQAGAHSTSTTAFPTEATTAEPSTVTVNYDKISQTISSVSTPVDTNNKRFFAYYDDPTDTIQTMSLQDMIDTFGAPVVDTLTNGSFTTDQAGTYRIHTATTLTGATEVSGANTAVFVDTRADTTLYTAAGIPETLDQPTTINSYYLFRVNAAAAGSLPTLYNIDGSNQLQQISTTDVRTILQEIIRHTAVNVVGSRIDYDYTTGTNLGSSMVDTRLNGSGNYQTLFVNVDDYRAQEFPDGTPTTINTYNLKVQQT